MKDRGEYASVFDVKHNRKTFRILFLADNLGKILFISSVGKDAFTFSVHIPNDFHAPKFFIGDNYGKLVDYLKTKGSSNNSLIPHDFLIEIEIDFPSAFQKTPSISERMSTLSRNLNKDLAPYFVTWKPWKENHTTYENMKQTEMLVGFEAALRLKKNNISSIWSHDPSKENLTKVNAWAKMLEK